MRKKLFTLLLLAALLLGCLAPAAAAQEITLPETLGEGLRADNTYLEIYFVPQAFSADALSSVLEEAAPNLRFSVSAGNDAALATGAAVTVTDPQSQSSKKYTVIVLGDMRGTGKTTAAAARQALRLSVGLDPSLLRGYLRALDVNGDTKLSAADARLLLRAAVGIENFGAAKAEAAVKIVYTPEAQIPLRHPELAAQLDSAVLTPKTTVPVRHLRDTRDMTWNITVTEADQKLIKEIFAALPAGATNLEKIYAAYTYIQKSFSYARGEGVYDTIWDKTPLDAVLNMHLAQCLQYNGAIAEVLAYMGYDVRIVEGMLGSGNYETDTVTSYWSHYWTELYLNNKTYLVEVGQPADGWNGDFMVFYTDTDGYLYYNTAKKAYSFLK